MLCGGTGITPMYQVIQHLLDEGKDKYQITLIFGNKTEQDILLKKELDLLNEEKLIKVVYTLDSSNEQWKGETGFITKEMIKKYIPANSTDHLVVSCGPKPMNQSIKKSIEALGFSSENYFKF